MIYNSLVNVQSNFQNKGIIPYQIKDGIIALYWSVLIYNQLESTIPINSFQLDMGKTVGWPTLQGSHTFLITLGAVWEGHQKKWLHLRGGSAQQDNPSFSPHCLHL